MFDARDEIIDLFEKGIILYKNNVFKQKKKRNQKKNYTKTNFQKILRMNQKVLTMSCLKNILNLQYLVLWPKNYLLHKIKRKTISQ